MSPILHHYHCQMLRPQQLLLLLASLKRYQTRSAKWERSANMLSGIFFQQWELIALTINASIKFQWVQCSAVTKSRRRYAAQTRIFKISNKHKVAIDQKLHFSFTLEVPPLEENPNFKAFLWSWSASAVALLSSAEPGADSDSSCSCCICCCCCCCCLWASALLKLKKKEKWMPSQWSNKENR